MSSMLDYNHIRCNKEEKLKWKKDSQKGWISCNERKTLCNAFIAHTIRIVAENLLRWNEKPIINCQWNVKVQSSAKPMECNRENINAMEREFNEGYRKRDTLNSNQQPMEMFSYWKGQ